MTPVIEARSFSFVHKFKSDLLVPLIWKSPILVLKVDAIKILFDVANCVFSDGIKNTIYENFKPSKFILMNNIIK